MTKGTTGVNAPDKPKKAGPVLIETPHLCCVARATHKGPRFSAASTWRPARVAFIPKLLDLAAPTCTQAEPKRADSYPLATQKAAQLGSKHGHPVEHPDPKNTPT